MFGLSPSNPNGCVLGHVVILGGSCVLLFSNGMMLLQEEVLVAPVYSHCCIQHTTRISLKYSVPTSKAAIFHQHAFYDFLESIFNQCLNSNLSCTPTSSSLTVSPP